jgi:peptidoglycan/LPS O-acetylase OafA/YrhL
LQTSATAIAQRSKPGQAEATATAGIAQAGQARIARVESLRALAAVGVVASHVFGATVGEFFSGIENRMASGVGFGAYFFFALSGCLLYMPFVRRDFGGGGSISLGRYALNRAVRIFPLYYVSLAAVLIVLERGGTLEQWVTWGLFLENFSPEEIETVNGVLWTIVIELHFYILLPLIAWVILRGSGGSLNRALLVLGAITLASLTLRLFYVIIPDRHWLDPVRMSLPSMFYFIGAGMFVALVRQAWAQQRPSWLRGPLASPDVWVLASIPFWFVFVANYDLEPLFAIGCFLLLGSAVLPLDRGFLVRGLDWRPLAVLGLASYSLYVWHRPILRGVTDREAPVLDPLISWTQDLVGSDYVGMLLILVPFCCAVALVSYALIEAPALRLRRRWGEFRRQAVELPGQEPSAEPSSALAAAPPLQSSAAAPQREPRSPAEPTPAREPA